MEVKILGILSNSTIISEKNVERIGKEVLQVSKEIAIKFIETQRMSPSNFAEIFPSVYKVVLETVMQGEKNIQQIVGNEQKK